MRWSLVLVRFAGMHSSYSCECETLSLEQTWKKSLPVFSLSYRCSSIYCYLEDYASKRDGRWESNRFNEWKTKRNR